jgi:hypothetical protein
MELVNVPGWKIGMDFLRELRVPEEDLIRCKVVQIEFRAADLAMVKIEVDEQTPNADLEPTHVLRQVTVKEWELRLSDMSPLYKLITGGN